VLPGMPAMVVMIPGDTAICWDRRIGANGTAKASKNRESFTTHLFDGVIRPVSGTK
jgi:hypothetical protein